MSRERAPPATNVQVPVVLVVDDDASMRAALRRLLTVARIPVEVFSSGAEFFAQANLDRPGCLLLDISMPEMSGLQVQAQLNQRGVSLPVLFLTGSADIPVAVTAMREGAVDFVEKPFQNDDLLARIRRAIAHHHRHRKISDERQLALQRLATLTPREHEVLELVVAGNTNKEIARVLGASHRTIEIHRVHLMEKMMAATLADLVRMRLLAGDKAPAGSGIA